MVTASEMGRKGGKAKSEAKTAAARKNAAKPRRKWVAAIAYRLDNVPPAFAFGVVLVAGKGPRINSSAGTFHEWVCAQVRENGNGLRDVQHLEFVELSAVAMPV